MWPNVFPQGLGMALVPAAMFSGDRLGVIGGMKVQRAEQIAVEFGQVGIEGDGLAIGDDGVLELRLFAQGVAGIAVGLGVSGVKGNGAMVGGDGLIDLSFL